MMEIDKIKESINEARRFQVRAWWAIKRLEKDKMASITGSKETAACRRASLDLTRILAELRK